jgi:dolichol-phosphate mannosyltransferase
VDLSVVIPVLNERENVERLLPRTARVLEQIGCSYELVVVDGGSRDGTAEAARAAGARVLVQRLPGYGGALREGLAAAEGTFILTLDADLSHDPDFIVKLWRGRERGDVVIASRYVRGGVAHMPRDRRALSRILNAFFAYGLGLPVRDLSSGFRLYRAAAVRELELGGTNFEILEEILVKAYDAGWRVLEIPFTYYPRDTGASHARIIRFGLDLLRAFARLWRLRQSIGAADYDERAFYSVVPLQRWWHRRRHELVCTWTRGAGKTLDVGCGSSVILQSLNDAVGVDVLHNKLRYMRRYDIPVVQGSALALPVRSESFECVVCSQVIERLPYDDTLFAELRRVLRPGGLLVLGTADYGTRAWRMIEPLYRVFAPAGYDDEHITRYTRARLLELCRAWGFRVEHEGYVFGAEIVLALRKEARPADALTTPTSPAELLAPVHAERIRESG